MKREGLEKVYGDISLFKDKPIVPYKNFLHKHVLQVFHWVMGGIYAANRKVLRQVRVHISPQSKKFALDSWTKTIFGMTCSRSSPKLS